MVSIQPGARSLVLRDSLLTWLLIQWLNIDFRKSQSEKRGIKVQTWEKDEKASILRIAEKACEAMCAAAKNRVKEGKEVGGWVREVVALVQEVSGASNGASLLCSLSKLQKVVAMRMLMLIVFDE